MRPGIRARPGFVSSIVLLIGVFVGTALLSAVAIYLILGHDGVIGGGGLILILAPLALAVWVTNAVSRWVLKPLKNRIFSKSMKFVMQFDAANKPLQMLAAHGIQLCVHCGHADVGAVRTKCAKCGEPLPGAGAAATPSIDAPSEPAQSVAAGDDAAPISQQPANETPVAASPAPNKDLFSQYH